MEKCHLRSKNVKSHNFHNHLAMDFSNPYYSAMAILEFLMNFLTFSFTFALFSTIRLIRSLIISSNINLILSWSKTSLSASTPKSSISIIPSRRSSNSFCNFNRSASSSFLNQNLLCIQLLKSPLVFWIFENRAQKLVHVMNAFV